MLIESGAYVLGALSPAERQSYERHLSTCAECRAEVGELAVLPGLMGRLDATEIEDDDVVSAPPTILPGVVTRIRRRRRNYRFAAIGGAVAAACLALIVGLTVPTHSAPTPQATTSSAALRTMVQPPGALPGTDVATASIALTAFDGGTRITGTCTYKTGQSTYQGPLKFAIVVHPKDGGQPDQVSSWSAWPGETRPINATTWFPLNEVASVDLVGSDGKALLTYQLS
jgi:hypothetical protein